MFTRFGRLAVPWIGSLAIQLVAGTLGLAGMAVAAGATASSWTFLSTGLAVYIAVVLAFTWLAVRNRPDNTRRRWLLANGVLAMLAVVAFSVSVLVPVD